MSAVGYNLPGFTDYISHQTPSKHSANPWVELVWKRVTDGNCPWNSDNVTQSSIIGLTNCDQYPSLASLPSIYQPDKYSTDNYDCISVYAQAIHNLLVAKCPSATGAAARQCVADNKLYDFIRNGTFQSTHGPIIFDDQGNSLTSYYVIYHFRQQPLAPSVYETVMVGKWLRQNSSLIVDVSQINWAKYKKTADINITVSFYN